MARVLLGLGANLGDRYASLQSVVKAMEGDFRDVIASPVYETPAWGITEQPDFLNAVVRADTDLTPSEVLAFAQSCEGAAGRTRELRAAGPFFALWARVD